MMNKLILAVSISLLSVAPVRAQGPLAPPGPPSPAMRSLEQIEPRIPIESLPFTITQPGSYYLTGNLDVESGTAAISIQSDHVSLNLMGFTVSGSATYGISVSPTTDDTFESITVRNGTIDGFGIGLRLLGSVGGLYEDLNIRNASQGVVLTTASSGNVIRRCTIANNSSWGVNFSTSGAGRVVAGNVIEDCVIVDNGSHGVRLRVATAGQVVDNIIRRCTIVRNGEGASTGVFFEASSADGLVSGNQVVDNTIAHSPSRGVELRSLASAIRNNTLSGNTIHGNDNAGIFGTAQVSGSGDITGTRIERNVISWNRFNGGIRFSDSGTTVTDMVIRDNVLADNGVGTAIAHLQVETGERNLIQGNHISGTETATSRGLNTVNTEGQLVVQNSVFGEPMTISANDRYGQIMTSTPLQNSEWLNFRLE